MVNFMRDNLFKDKSMVKGYIDGQMEMSTTDISKWIRGKG